jgi:hypothetical protein
MPAHAGSSGSLPADHPPAPGARLPGFATPDAVGADEGLVPTLSALGRATDDEEGGMFRLERSVDLDKLLAAGEQQQQLSGPAEAAMAGAAGHMPAAGGAAAAAGSGLQAAAAQQEQQRRRQRQSQPYGGGSLCIPMSMSMSLSGSLGSDALGALEGRQASPVCTAPPAAAAATAGEPEPSSGIDSSRGAQHAAAGGSKEARGGSAALLLLQRWASETLQQGQQLRQQQQLEAEDGDDSSSRAATTSTRGHERLQKLIPQKAPPRQQQLPARILTWAGGSPVAAASLAVPAAVAAGVAPVPAGAGAPGGGYRAGSSFLEGGSSLPREIRRASSSGRGEAAARLRSSGSNGSLASSDGGGGGPGSAGNTHHGGNAVISALIAADTSITGSFRSALLASLCGAEQGGRGGGGGRRGQQDEQQQQWSAEKGAGHGGRPASFAVGSPVLSAMQQQQQVSQFSGVVAFSFPRTSSSPAFGHARLAPSMSPQQQQKARGRQFAVGPTSEWASAAATGMRPVGGGDGSNAVAAVLTAGPMLRLSRSSNSLLGGGSSRFQPQQQPQQQQAFLYGPNQQQQQQPQLGVGRRVVALSPIPGSPLSTQGTSFGAVSYGGSSTGSLPASAGGSASWQQWRQQQSQQQQRLGSSPKLLHSHTWAPPAASALTAAVGTVSLPAGASRQGAATAAATETAGTSTPQRQQGLLSAQMRRTTSPDLPAVRRQYGSTAAVQRATSDGSSGGTVAPLLAAAAAAVDDGSSRGSSSSSQGEVAEKRVRGSSVAAAALGLPDDAAAGCYSQSLPAGSSSGWMDAGASWLSHSRHQQQQPVRHKGRVSWANDIAEGDASARPAAAACREQQGARGARGGLSRSLMLLPSSAPWTAALDTAASGGTAGVLNSAALSSSGRPPTHRPLSKFKRAGMMRGSQSCMDFRSLPSAAGDACSEDAGVGAGPAGAAAAGSSGDSCGNSCDDVLDLTVRRSVSAEELSTAAVAAIAAAEAEAAAVSKARAVKPQQRSANILQEAFAAKGHLLSPVAMSLSTPGISSSSFGASGCDASSSSPPCATSSGSSFAARVLRGHARAAAPAAAVPVPGAQGPSGEPGVCCSLPLRLPCGVLAMSVAVLRCVTPPLNLPPTLISATHLQPPLLAGLRRSARSAPEAALLLSCSWHEIEPVAADHDEDGSTLDPIAAARRAQRLAGSGGSSGLLAAAAAGGRGVGSPGSGGYVYQHAGDFYGAGRGGGAGSSVSSRQRPASWSQVSYDAAAPGNGSSAQLPPLQHQRRSFEGGSSPAAHAARGLVAPAAIAAAMPSGPALGAGAMAAHGARPAPAAAAGKATPRQAQHTPISSSHSFFDLAWWQSVFTYERHRQRQQQQQQYQQPLAPPGAVDLRGLMLLGSQADAGSAARMLRQARGVR